MSITREEARQEVARLVAKCQGLTAPAIKKYTEADTRRVFIMPLFHALGWDVYSREEVAEEVKAATGRVDYVFKLHGVSQFYLEAKALRAELTKPEYIKQAITYAYNKGITWAVLTDFEGLQVYNAQTGRLFINLSHDNYIRDFDDLWLLSRGSLETNALNEKAEKYGALPPRLGIEQRLFNQLRQWREELFTQLYHYNPNLSYNQIDEIIQRLFNRLIFIRTCEDRRIEDKALLGAVREWRSSGRRGELIEVLRRIFRDCDGYYDSDLFAPHLVDQVFIESITIEGIINGLYEIPGGMASYDFSLIDADVLGAVYEQYLGHIATVVKQRTKEAQARMDLGYPVEPTFEITAKKQRRKERGIYYTPRFVTNYIVKESVGRFLKERSHNEILNIKILDPACGSGSFLIRAYDELLNYHAYRSGKSVSELDQWERLPILIKNIFGVDLDMQAVEIARLNLLLRSLAKRETLPSLADNIRRGNSLISGAEEELKKYFGDNWQEKKPFNWEQEFSQVFNQGKKTRTLTITIDTNAINAKQRDEKLNLLEQYSQRGLVEIFKTDVLDTELLTDKTNYAEKRRDKASMLPEDIGICVLNHSRLGHTRLAGDEDVKLQDEIIKVLFQKTRHQLTTQQLRDAMHLHTHLMHQRDFFVTTDKGHVLSKKEELHKKFGINAGTPEECLQFIEGFLSKGFDIVIGNPPYVRPHKLETSDKRALWAQYQVYRAKSDIYACFIQRAINLLKPGGYASYIVSNTFISLESFMPLRKYILDTCCILYLGLTPKKVFEAATVETIVLGLKKESNESARRQNKISITEYRDGAFERIKEIPQEIFYSTYVNIFDLSWNEAALPFSTKIELNTGKLSETVTFCYGLKTADDAIFLTHTPSTPEHKRLLRRSDFGRYSIEFKGEFVWYVPDQMRKHRITARPGGRERFEMPKILVQDIGKRLVATLDDDYFYVKDALMLHQKENGLDLKFVLAIINSKLLNYWYAQKFRTLSVAKNAILQLPIHRINFDNPDEKKRHDNLLALVDKMLELNKRLAPIRDTYCNERDELLREINHTDYEIDNLVYDLYGLTEEERKIVEGS